MYDIVLLEKCIETGLRESDAVRMLSLVNGNEIIPIEIEAHKHESSAMGFISFHAAEAMDFDYSSLEEFITAILDDMELENEDGIYHFNDFSILLTRGEYL